MNVVEYAAVALAVTVVLYFACRAVYRASDRYVEVAVSRALAATYPVAVASAKRESAEAYVRASVKASAGFAAQLKGLAAEHQLTPAQAAQAMREAGLGDAAGLVEAGPAFA